jgi:hypothetical protein
MASRLAQQRTVIHEGRRGLLPLLPPGSALPAGFDMRMDALHFERLQFSFHGEKQKVSRRMVFYV